MEEIRCETGEDVAAGRDLVLSFVFSRPELFYREIEIVGAVDLPWIPSIDQIPCKHITIRTAGTDTGTAVPRVPCDCFRRAILCLIII